MALPSTYLQTSFPSGLVGVSPFLLSMSQFESFLCGVPGSNQASVVTGRDVLQLRLPLTDVPANSLNLHIIFLPWSS